MCNDIGPDGAEQIALALQVDLFIFVKKLLSIS